MQSSIKEIRSVIDLGTNTCLLLIAEAGGEKLKALCEAQEIPRIGKGLYETGIISEQSLETVVSIFTAYRKLSDEYGAERILAFGTSALRDALNSNEFIRRISERTGIRVIVISGKQEAECAFLGAVHDLPAGDYAVIDIGGGSTELSCYEGDELQNNSVDIGSVRITEKFFRNGSDYNSAEAYVAEALARIPVPGSRKKFVGVAGTLTTLAAIALGLQEFDFEKIHGHVLTREAVSELAGSLAAMNEQERSSLGSYMKGRSDIITAGALILKSFMSRTEADRIRVSAKGLRYGLMLRFNDFFYKM